MKKFKLIWFKINSIVFFSIIFCGGILFLVLPKEKISESEKRKLTQLPVLNFTNIFSGKFESEFDNYYNDNFIFRNHFISIANYIKENFGIKDNEIRIYSNVSVHKKNLKKPALASKDAVKDSNELKSFRTG